MVPFTPRLLRPTLRTALLRNMLGITILEATATTMVGIAAIGAAGNYMMKSADQAQEQQAGAHLEAVRKGVERYVKAEHSILSRLAPGDAKLKPTLKDLRDGNYLPNSDVLTDLNSFSQTYAVRIRQVPTGAGKPANLEALVITQPGGSASVPLLGAALRRVARGLGTQGGYIDAPPAGSPTPSTLAVVGHGGSWEAKPADFGYTPADLKAGHMAVLSVFNGADLVSAASPHKPDDYLHRKSDAAGRNKMEVDLNMGDRKITDAEAVESTKVKTGQIEGKNGLLNIGSGIDRLKFMSAVENFWISNQPGVQEGDLCGTFMRQTGLAAESKSGRQSLLVCQTGPSGSMTWQRVVGPREIVQVKTPSRTGRDGGYVIAHCPSDSKIIGGYAEKGYTSQTDRYSLMAAPLLFTEGNTFVVQMADIAGDLGLNNNYRHRHHYHAVAVCLKN